MRPNWQARKKSTYPRSMTSHLPSPVSLLLRFALAAVLTVGLILFLVATKAVRSSTDNSLSITSMETINPVSLPAPPPPPPAEPPPPPQNPELPKLDIQLDSIAPPIKANPDRDVEMRMEFTEFAPQKEAPREQMMFSLKDLDSKPQLVNRPTVTYPKSQAKRGITKAEVVLEVVISPAGKARVVRIIDTPHPDFTELAYSFMNRARFTSPKKDGRAVQSNFEIPLSFSQ